MKKIPVTAVFEAIGFFLVLCLTNWRAVSLGFFHPRIEQAWVEVLLWITALATLFFLLKSENLLKEYFLRWQKNWLLILFIGLAGASLSWSVSQPVSAYHAVVFSFSSLAAIYFATRFSLDQFITRLALFGCIITIFSIALVILVPNQGMMLNYPYYGAWRGLYWHRNHLGSITALYSLVFLVKTLLAFRSTKITEGFFWLVFYLLTLLTMYKTDSATAKIVAILLHGAIIIILLWLRFNQRLRRSHYTGIAAVAAGSGILLLLNLDRFFAIFNRSANMTGRLPLWQFLFQEVISKRPFVGYGFGAVWSLPAFREMVQKSQGWPFHVLIGDNGFVDIALHLGFIGLALFLAIFIQMIVRSIRHAVAQRTLMGFLPAIFLLYSFLANLSFSLFFETETFVWMVLLTGVCACIAPIREPG